MRILFVVFCALLLVGWDVTARAQSSGGYIGLDIQNGSGQSAHPMVARVHAGSPGALAGLRIGDMIFSINGEETDSAEDALRIMSAYSPGARVTIVFLRANARQQVSVVLSTRAAVAYQRALECTGVTLIQRFYAEQHRHYPAWVMATGTSELTGYDAVITRWEPVLRGSSDRLGMTNAQVQTDIRAAMSRFDFTELFANPTEATAVMTRAGIRQQYIRTCATEQLPSY